jgi:hypothetical protein
LKELECAGKEDIAQKESSTQHIKPTIPNKECLQRMRNSKGKFHRHTQQQAPNNEDASKGCATSREETNYTKTQLKLKIKALK